MSEPNEPSDTSDGDSAPGPGTPENPFIRFDARLLDPTTAVRIPGQPAPSVTAYRGDALLITATTKDEAEAIFVRIDELAKADGLQRVGTSPFTEIGKPDEATDDAASGSGVEQEDAGSGSDQSDDAGADSDQPGDAGSGSDQSDDPGADSDQQEDAGSISDQSDDAGADSDQPEDAGSGVEQADPEYPGADDDDPAGQALSAQERREADPDPAVAIHDRRARLLARAQQTRTPLVFPIFFAPITDEPAPAVDVWPLFQRIRALNDAALNNAVGLDHLMYSAANIAGDPAGPRGTALIGGNPAGPRGTSEGVASYGSPGWGGHGPVAVVMGPPRPEPGACCPRVVVLDTGVGSHPWYTAVPVIRELWVDGDPVGMDVSLPAVQRTDPESAKPDAMTGELPTHSGHGTFISGLIRQLCPEAHITTLRIMDADGVVTEDSLTDAVMALGNLLDEHPGALDVLVLSLGYYAETSEDMHYTAGLHDLLQTLAERGVVTFAAAGNDSTKRRSFPAAFAATWASQLPLVSVAALNPNGTVALFSNDGDWVLAEALGANIVSTAPVVEQGGNQAAVSFRGLDGRHRATLDPDDFRSGFAVWSGTSFAAPVLAGQYLAKLVDAKCNRDVSVRKQLALELLRP